jgi:signal transduction histidine kinase
MASLASFASARINASFRSTALPLRDERGNIVKWYGTMTDIEDRKRAEEALRKANADLAHITRVITMGELTATIAHEINQPLAAIVTNADACMVWLSNEPPNLEEARAAVESIAQDGTRASEVIQHIRAMFNQCGQSWPPAWSVGAARDEENAKETTPLEAAVCIETAGNRVRQHGTQPESRKRVFYSGSGPQCRRLLHAM